MKVITSQTNLNKALALASRALSTRVQLPVLSHFLFEATKTGLVISATNLEIGIRTQVGAKVSSEGALTVPARAVAEFVASIPAGNIDLEASEDSLKIASAGFKATLAGINASEFPPLPTLSGKSQALDKSLLTTIAGSVAYAAAADESRPVLTGVRFKSVENSLVVVATDGFRLSQKTIPLNSNLSSLISDLILPARTIIEVARIATEVEGEEIKLETVAKNNQVIFSLGSTDLISRVLEGNYPDTAKIIPTDSPIKVIIDRAEFITSLRAASIFARENNNIVKFKIQNSKFKIMAQAAQKGESEVELEAETEGEGEIAFNYKFVMDALNSLSCERVVLAIKDSLSPGVFSPVGDPTLLALIMPVRV